VIRAQVYRIQVCKYIFEKTPQSLPVAGTTLRKAAGHDDQPQVIRVCTRRSVMVLAFSEDRTAESYVNVIVVVVDGDVFSVGPCASSKIDFLTANGHLTRF
jgi:hypothetical protein